MPGARGLSKRRQHPVSHAQGCPDQWTVCSGGQRQLPWEEQETWSVSVTQAPSSQLLPPLHPL